MFTGGVFTGGVFTGGVFTGGVFTAAAVFTGGVFTGGVFTGGVFTGGVFTGGLLTGGVFTGGVLTGGVFTGGVLTGGVFTGGLLTGGVLTGGCSPVACSPAACRRAVTGGVSTGAWRGARRVAVHRRGVTGGAGGVSTGAVTGGGGLVAASIPPVAPGMALTAPAAVSEVSDGVVDVTSVAAVEGAVRGMGVGGGARADNGKSRAERCEQSGKPKASEALAQQRAKYDRKLPPQIARTLSVLALVPRDARDALPHRSPEPHVSQTPITTSTPGRGARITSFRGGRGVKRGKRRARSRSLGSPRLAAKSPRFCFHAKAEVTR